MFKIIITCIISFGLCSSLSVENNESTSLEQHGRIVGGLPDSIDTIPYLISLQFSGKHTCGGTLIASKWVLTAAHCVTRAIIRPWRLKIRVNSNSSIIGGQVHNVRRIIPHMLYNILANDYDYALLQLRTEVKLSEYAQLPGLNDTLPNNSLLRIAGWGQFVNSPRSNLSEALLSTYVPVVDHNECVELYKGIRITTRMFCAGFVGVGEKDACFGDSGGPALLDDIQWGIVSWGDGCGDPKFPGVYSNVQFIRRWITTTTGV